MKILTGLIASTLVSSAPPPYISNYHYDPGFGGWFKIVLAEQQSKKECGSINISANQINFTFSCSGEIGKGLIPLSRIYFEYKNNILSAQSKQSGKNIFPFIVPMSNLRRLNYILEVICNKQAIVWMKPSILK